MRKVYVKYDSHYPNLPVAVADSKRELASMLGISKQSVFSAFSHNRGTFAEVEIELDDIELYNIKTYPDNDGGLWYWHPVTGQTVYLRD